MHRGPLRRPGVFQAWVGQPKHRKPEVGQQAGHGAKILGRLDLMQHDA
jgi:hypothetical protein